MTTQKQMTPAHASNGLLEVIGVTRSFAGHPQPVVNDVHFVVQKGEIFVLLGPSGCGKTTTLRMIGGFESPDAGEIRLGGEVLVGAGRFVPPEARGIGFVFQDYALFPHLSVADNVGYGLRHLSSQERKAIVLEMLSLVGLERLAARMPQQLSGGEQQRIALARSLARRPKVLLLDEPFSNLDEQRRAQMRDELRRLLKAQGMSALMVTHHQEEALTMGDRIGIMRDGVLQQVGQPADLYHAPKTAFVADFLGQTNLFSADAKGDRAVGPLGSLSIQPDAEGDVLLSLRPEALSLGAVDSADEIEDGVTGVVVSSQFFGAHTSYLLRCGEHVIRAIVTGRAPLAEGTNVVIEVHGAARVVLDDRS